MAAGLQSTWINFFALSYSWREAERELEYAKLLEACRPLAKALAVDEETAREQVAEQAIQLDCEDQEIYVYAFSPDGKRALTGANDNLVRLLGCGERTLPAHAQRSHE